MGNWLTSTLMRFDSLFFSKNHSNFLEYRRNQNAENSQFMVRLAAEIVASQRRNMHSDDDDTDFSSDDECPQIDAAEQARMFERERLIAFSGRCTIGDHQSLNQLRDDISLNCECAPSTSITNYCMSLEIGAKNSRRDQTTLKNSFAPNRRKNVIKLPTKSFCCQYAKNGQILIVASQDERIRFFKRNFGGARNGSKLAHSMKYEQYNELRADTCVWSILDVAVSEDAKILCYSTWRQAIYLANLEDRINEGGGTMWNHIDLEVGNANNMAVFTIRLSKDSRQIICGDSGQNIHVFDTERKCRLRTIGKAHDDDVNAICFADDSSNMIYSGGDDGLIKVWDRRAWCDRELEPIGTFAGHRDGITYIDSRGDDRYLLSNSKDQTIKLWDLRKFATPQAIQETRLAVKSHKWDYRWQPAPPGLCQPIPGDTSIMTLRGHNVLHTLVRAKFSPESTGKRYIYTGCARGEVVVYDILTGVVSNRLKGHIGVVRDIDWHPEHMEMVSASWDGVTSVWYWDERANHVTAPFDGAQFGDEDSCDESFTPILHQNLDKNGGAKRLRKHRVM